jgi:hypothetical protein
MAKSKATPYHVHPGVGMVRKWVDALPGKTGKTLEEWSEIIQRAKLPDAKSRRAWLVKEHGFGGNESYWMAEYSQGKHTWDFDPKVYLKQAVQFVDEQFAGPKAVLRPIFEAVLDFARTLGSDVRICPCKTIVPIYRNRVFAELKPATKTRLELAFALGETPFDPPFIHNPRAKGNDRLRHLIPLFAIKDFNATAKKALKTAYKLDEGKSRSLGM